LTLAISLSLTLRRIHDSKVAIEVISDQLLARSDDVKELEDIDAELNADLEAETRKWHSRWPEPEECCMILKMELSRGQAELEANYQQFKKQFAEMEPSKADCTLVDLPLPPLPGEISKSKERAREPTKKIVGDLITFESQFKNENIAGSDFIQKTCATCLVDLITDCQEEDPMTCRDAVETGKSDILVDLNTEIPKDDPESKVTPKTPCISDDLAVLVTDFPIPTENGGNSEDSTEVPTFRDVNDIVQIITQGYVQLIKKRNESVSKELKDMKTEVVEVRKAKLQMQPLYNIGLAIRKRQVEIDSGKEKEDKNQTIIADGNSAAHHAQVLADATWMMSSPAEQRFKEMYNGVSAKTVLEHRDHTTFLDILNWNLNMRQFTQTGGINRTVFSKLFQYVFTKICPSFKLTDKDFEQDKDLRDTLVSMRSQHSVAYERDIQTHQMNRRFLKNQQARAQRAS
jgi:hypothetical protein